MKQKDSFTEKYNFNLVVMNVHLRKYKLTFSEIKLLPSSLSLSLSLLCEREGGIWLSFFTMIQQQNPIEKQQHSSLYLKSSSFNNDKLWNCFEFSLQ